MQPKTNFLLQFAYFWYLSCLKSKLQTYWNGLHLNSLVVKMNDWKSYGFCKSLNFPEFRDGEQGNFILFLNRVLSN